MQKVENRPNSVNSKNHVIDVPNNNINQSTIDLDGENRGEGEENYFFSTYNNTDITTNGEDGMTNPSMNAFMNPRRFMKPAYPFSVNNESKLEFNPPNSEFVLTTSNQIKKRVSSAELQKQAILPNLNAVRRHNIPLKGLAFREAKCRINYTNSTDTFTNTDISQNKKSEANASIAYYTYQNSKTLPEEYFRNFNINPNTIINTSYLEDTNKTVTGNTNNCNSTQNKKTVKEIFRGIRRGVTIMNHMSHSADSSANFSEKLELNRKSAKQRTTRENLNNLKILNVKGDRITSFEILNNVAPYSSGKKLSRSQRLEQSLKTNVKPSAYLSASNMSFKSNMSAQSLGNGLTQNITFRNTSPEIS